jgi:hypothetical protein
MSAKGMTMSEVAGGNVTTVNLKPEAEDTLLKTTHPSDDQMKSVMSEDDAVEKERYSLKSPSAASAAAAAEMLEINLAPVPISPVSALPFPGAFAMFPTGVTEEEIEFDSCAFSMSHDDVSPGHLSQAATEDNMNGLAVADLVDDTPLSLQIASPHEDGTDQDKDAANKSKRAKATTLLAVILLMAIIASLVTFMVHRKETSKESHSVSHASSSPSEAPTISVDGYLLSLLPEETAAAIFLSSASDSPQSQAFQWLLEDFEHLGITNQTEQRIRQRFSLATLYFATDGDMWLANGNWLNHSAHECVWYNQPEFAMQEMMSVMYPTYLDHFYDQPPPSTCNSQGLYQHLWLDLNNLKGALPEELYMLTSLETMSISLGLLEGSLSTNVGMLTSLQGLMFFGAWPLSPGAIPSEIGLLTHLRALSLHGNNIQGYLPSELWQLTNLQYLILGNNPDLKGTIPSEIGNLSQLRWLTFHEMDLTGETTAARPWVVVCLILSLINRSNVLFSIQKVRSLARWAI